MNTGFLKLTIDFDQIGIFKKRPTALLLLLLIAKRAKRSNNHPDKDLEIGESWIGDWACYCTSERCYRTDKKWLEKYQIVTIKVTTKGTIAKIVGTSYVDINSEKVTDKVTDKRRTSDGQVTTNKIEKIEKNTVFTNTVRKPKDLRVDLIIETFKNKYAKLPVDRKPRFIAYNLSIATRRFVDKIKERRPDLTYEVVIDKAFDYYQSKYPDSQPEYIDTVYRYAKQLFADQLLKINSTTL